jgi:anti-sigma B factor antagonist
MEIEIKKHQGLVILKPEIKSIDSTVSVKFKDKVIDQINQGNIFILLNMSQVDFLDSGGLIAMIAILKALNQSKGDIIICELNVPIKNLFHLTRMNNVFKMCATEKEGLEYLMQIKKNHDASIIFPMQA